MNIKSPAPRLPKPKSPVRLIRKSVELHPGSRVTVDFNCAESPLSWLRTRKTAHGHSLIDAAQYGAGLKLHADYVASQFMPQITTNWQPCLADGAHLRSPSRRDLLHQSEKVLAARQRYYAALEAVGPELSPILVEICCHATGIEAAERVLSMPRRSGKVVLDLALTRLARWYGLIGAADRKDRSSRRRRFRQRPLGLGLDARNERDETVRALRR